MGGKIPGSCSDYSSAHRKEIAKRFVLRRSGQLHDGAGIICNGEQSACPGNRVLSMEKACFTGTSRAFGRKPVIAFSRGWP
jgi:hypothetical protein